MKRDLRDPSLLGHLLLSIPKKRRKLSQRFDHQSEWLDMCPNWTGDGFMSTNPANHHSRTPQVEGDLTA